MAASNWRADNNREVSAPQNYLLWTSGLLFTGREVSTGRTALHLTPMKQLTADCENHMIAVNCTSSNADDTTNSWLWKSYEVKCTSPTVCKTKEQIIDVFTDNPYTISSLATQKSSYFIPLGSELRMKKIVSKFIKIRNNTVSHFIYLIFPFYIFLVVMTNWATDWVSPCNYLIYDWK